MRIFFTIFLLYYDSHSASNAVFCLPQKCIGQEMPEIQEMYHFCKLCIMYMYKCQWHIGQAKPGEFLCVLQKWRHKENLFVRRKQSLNEKLFVQQFDIHSYSIRSFEAKKKKTHTWFWKKENEITTSIHLLL